MHRTLVLSFSQLSELFGDWSKPTGRSISTLSSRAWSWQLLMSDASVWAFWNAIFVLNFYACLYVYVYFDSNFDRRNIQWKYPTDGAIMTSAVADPRSREATAWPRRLPTAIIYISAPKFEIESKQTKQQRQSKIQIVKIRIIMRNIRNKWRVKNLWLLRLRIRNQGSLIGKEKIRNQIDHALHSKIEKKKNWIVDSTHDERQGLGKSLSFHG